MSAYYRQYDTYIDISTPAAPVLYVCTTAGDKTSSVWAQISGGGSSGFQQFKIISDGGDYWVGKSWNGTTLGTLSRNIIKPFKLRAGTNKISSEVIRGVTYSYTYAAVTVGSVTGYYTRAVSGSDGSSETDYMIPDPIANDIIAALPCTTTIVGSIPVTIAAASVNAGGSGYVSGDIGHTLTVAGGTGTAATFIIASVAAGLVTGVTMVTSGNYTVAPSLVANASTGSTTGSGATFNLTLATNLLDINIDARAWSK